MKDESCNEFWYLSLTNQPNVGQNEKCTQDRPPFRKYKEGNICIFVNL